MKILRMFWILVLALTSAPIGSAIAEDPIDPSCDVTTNDEGDPGIPQYIIPGTMGADSVLGPAGTEVYPDDGDVYGSEGIWVSLPDDGVYRPEMPGWVHGDGSIDWGKFGLYRDDIASGAVSVVGHLTSDPETQLESMVMDGYGLVGFQVGSITFPDVGCWEITITSGSATMEFTVWVVRDFVPPVSTASTPAAVLDSTCDVTSNDEGDPGIPQHMVPVEATIHGTLEPSGAVLYPEENQIYGSNGLWIYLPLDGVFRPLFFDWLHEDGSIEWGRFVVYKDDRAQGDITISGHLVNDPKVKLTAHVGQGYGAGGLRLSSLIFPEPGGWNVSITSGEAVLDFTVQVVAELESGNVPAETASVSSDCNVTSNAEGAPGRPQYANTVAGSYGDLVYGQEGLWFFLPVDGVYRPAEQDWVLSDGSILWGKILIYRDDTARGEVSITGHLRDNLSLWLESKITEGYGDVGLQLASMIFPDIGCWDITITSGPATMEFTIWVTNEVGPWATPATA